MRYYSLRQIFLPNPNSSLLYPRRARLSFAAALMRSIYSAQPPRVAPTSQS
jgi:hypothetical protein